jgi:hypothetical protein
MSPAVPADPNREHAMAQIERNSLVLMKWEVEKVSGKGERFVESAAWDER